MSSTSPSKIPQEEAFLLDANKDFQQIQFFPYSVESDGYLFG